MTTVPAPSWAEAIDSWAIAMRAGGLAATTIKLRREQLALLARWAGDRGPWDLKLADLQDWQGGREHWGQERRRSVRTTLRRFYTWGVQTGRTDDNPALRLDRVKATPPNPRPTPESVWRRAVMRAKPRERIMLRLAVECGLRRAEVAQVHSRDLEQDLGGWTLIVHGKGRKVRWVPLPASLAAEIRTLPDGYAFPGSDHGHLSPRWVGTLIGQLLGDQYGMHSLRHSFATEGYAIDRDVFTLQAVLGHASSETTRRYVATPPDAVRTLVEEVSRRRGIA